jgi:glycosyltransferase involved in cell wall biosynthesis
MKKPHLVIIPSVPVWENESGPVFERKFFDGVRMYADLWPGTITCILRRSVGSMPEFGAVAPSAGERFFETVILDRSEPLAPVHVQDASIVLASGDDFGQLHVSTLCRKAGVRCVYVIEYTPETRAAIMKLETQNPILRMRRSLYLWSNERKRRAAFMIADGIQSNGTPAFNEYREVRNSLLYFDTRVDGRGIIRDAELHQRLEYLRGNSPLRLAFSGRLIRMKGADHLVEVARRLKLAGVPFTMSIYGTGELEQEMRSFISRHQLEDCVGMKGVLSFHDELLPELRKQVDLFVCLHRQSDPSCTYLETLSCGIPIVGYRNRAFHGLLGIADIGWGADMDDIDGVCRLIREIDGNRQHLANRSINSAFFSRRHSAETTFRKRIDHLLSLV